MKNLRKKDNHSKTLKPKLCLILKLPHDHRNLFYLNNLIPLRNSLEKSVSNSTMILVLTDETTNSSNHESC